MKEFKIYVDDLNEDARLRLYSMIVNINTDEPIAVALFPSSTMTVETLLSRITVVDKNIEFDCHAIECLDCPFYDGTCLGNTDNIFYDIIDYLNSLPKDTIVTYNMIRPYLKTLI